MSGLSGTEIGGPSIAREHDERPDNDMEYYENQKCTSCGHPRKNHTKPGCTICSCNQFTR